MLTQSSAATQPSRLQADEGQKLSRREYADIYFSATMYVSFLQITEGNQVRRPEIHNDQHILDPFQVFSSEKYSVLLL